MSRPDPDSTDVRLDRALGHLLRAGVILAAAVVVIGGAAYLTAHWSDAADFHTFHKEDAELCEPLGIVRDALNLNAAGVIQLGLLLLIATPVARVAFSAFAFARLRDWLYVVVTLIVLTLLLYSLFRST